MEIDRETRPRVLVFGAGAVGCFLGGVLAGAGSSVTLLGRVSLIQASQSNGLLVARNRQVETVWPQVITSIDELEYSPDIVLLTTKVYSVPGTLPDLRRIVSPETTLVTIQNGLGTEELVSECLPEATLVAASLTLSAEFEAPGCVASTSRSGGIALAPVSDHADADRIVQLFRKAGLPATLEDDYRSMKWSKLILNMMANATPAILDWTPERVYEHRRLFELERAAVLEALMVLRAEGSHLASLPGFPVPLLPWIFTLPASLAQLVLKRRIGGGRGDKLPSLQLDLQAGRHRTEARWLYGAVVDAGGGMGVETPVNRRLLRIMEGVTRNPNLRNAFRDRADLLLRNVALAQLD